MITNFPLTLFYDGECPVCALEMDHLRERSRDGRLLFVDIRTPGFDPAVHGLTLAALDAEIHALRPDGSVIQGIEVLRLAYEAAGLGWVLRPTGWGPMRPLADFGYRVFARHRRRISLVAASCIDALRAYRARRASDAMRACQAGACRAPAGPEAHDGR